MTDADIKPRERRSIRGFAIDRMKKSLKNKDKEIKRLEFKVLDYIVKLNREKERYKKLQAYYDNQGKKFQDIGKKSSKNAHLEIIMRSIICYHNLSEDGTFSFKEFAILVSGYQYEHFTLKNILERADRWYGIKGDIQAMIDTGFVKKEGRMKYYLTVSGQDRLNEILDYVYNQKLIKVRIAKRMNR